MTVRCGKCKWKNGICFQMHMDRVKRIWYLSHMRAAKVQASLRIRAVSPEPSLLAHTSSESRGTFRQKARPLAPLNGWACAVKICHDGMLEDTNSLDGAHISRWLERDYLNVLWIRTLCSFMPDILKSIRESLTVHTITSQHEMQLAGHFNICSQVVSFGMY